MNRKERRAAARECDTPTTQEYLTQDSLDYILAQPDRTGPKGKTLLELADARQAELNRAANKVLKISDPNAEVSKIEPEDVLDELAPFFIALLYGSTLTMVHFTLDVLVHNQYAQNIDWDEIISHIWTALPSFIIIVYVLNMQPIVSFPWTRQVLLLAFACFLGCYLIRLGNDQPYMAVMKRAPPVGTIWLWTFIEMRKRCEVVNLVVVGGYCWWMGFTVI